MGTRKRRRPLTAEERSECSALGGYAVWDKPQKERDKVRAAISAGLRRKWAEWKAAGFKRKRNGPQKLPLEKVDVA